MPAETNTPPSDAPSLAAGAVLPLPLHLAADAILAEGRVLSAADIAFLETHFLPAWMQRVRRLRRREAALVRLAAAMPSIPA